MITGAVFAVAVVVITGVMAIELSGARERAARTTPAAEAAAGVVLLAVTGTIVIAAGGRVTPALVYFVFGFAAAAGALRWVRRRAAGPVRGPGEAEGAGEGGEVRMVGRGGTAAAARRDRVAAVLIVAAAVVWLALLVAASRDRLAWDGWAIWTFKARVLFDEGTLPPAVLDPTGVYAFAHPEYPLAVPLLDWWIYHHAGAARPALLSMLGALWFGLLPILMWRATRPYAGERWAALAALGVTTFWPISLYAIGGYADVLITVATLGAVIELERLATEPDRRGAVRLAWFLALAAVAKNEGLVLALIGGLVGAWLLWRGGARRAGTFAVLGLPFAAAAPWLWTVWRLRLEPHHLAGARPGVLEAVGRVPDVVGALIELGTTRSWIPLPWLILLGVLLVARRTRATSRASWVFLGGYTLAFLTVYVVTPLDPDWLIGSTLDRLVGMVIPAAVLLTVREVGSLRRDVAGAMGGSRAARTAPSDSAVPSA